MSTATRTHTLTIPVLDVDGTLAHQDHEVHDDATIQAAICAAIGPGTTELRKVGRLYEMDVLAAAHTSPAEAPVNTPANAFVALQGDLETFAMGRVAFVVTHRAGHYISPDVMQYVSLSHLVDAWKALQDEASQQGA